MKGKNQKTKIPVLQITENGEIIKEYPSINECALSENIDVDLVETYINLTSADTVYNASLQTAAKIAQNSLLDFIR